ncbi:hypothetical protein [Gordonia sihwensis]|uniref:hypothetical protein n=1 Tax=Gordonia sihwensis TaxID=173559 RepID=UPI0005EE34A3|nr:hypothetical protein [Gordonia sihwensis]KJR10490.1 hypothetical protein UG54_00360 [Gordonia sihwensis]
MAGAVTALSAALVATAACTSDSSTSTDSSDASTASSSLSSTRPAPTQGGTAPTQPGTAPTATDGRLGSVQTVQGEGFTAQIQVKNEPRRTVTSNGKTDLLVFDVVIDVQSGQLKPLYTSWRLVTGSSESYYRVPSDLPNALGTAPIDHHAEGVITFANPKLQDSVTIDRIELFDKLSPSTSDAPAMQWRAPSPILIGDLPVMKP